MRGRKIVSAVLIVAVILGIVGCKAKGTRKIVEDDIGITTASELETQKEPTDSKEESTTTTQETTENAETTASDTVVPEATEPSESEVERSEPAETETTPAPTKDPTPTESPRATETPAPTNTPVPTSTPEPTATPVPTNTPTSTNTPTPVPTPFDIDKSAKENGYEIIDIDMGNGQTERIYGVYVDMSGLDDKVNDYRESIGLPRLSKDTSHISETKIRAAEISLSGHFSHHRPNGKGGSETNIVGGTNVDECYQDLYNSPGHRAAWEDPYAITIYSVGFRKMEYDYDKGEWVGAGRYTAQYMDYNL